jgi:membrane protease YdiL (CAAX protease family)
MSEAIQEAHEAESIEARERHAARERRLRWIELFLVIAVAFGGFFLNSLFVLVLGTGALQHSVVPGWTRWSQAIVLEITGLSLLGYIMARRKIRFADLGLRWSFRDVGMGFLVAAGSYMVYVFGTMFIHALQRALSFPSSGSVKAEQFLPHFSLLAIPFFLLNPFFEELIVRAYLMTEVKALTGSWLLAATVSTLVQTSYHLYYGWVGALSVMFQFALLSLYYARARRATPVIVAHAIFDWWGLLRMW